MPQIPRRRLLSALGACCALVVTAPPLQASPAGIGVANEFRDAYAEWGEFYKKHTPGANDAKEWRAWRNVEEHWSALRKFIKREYSE